MSRAQELAEAHWNYIQALIMAHGSGDELAQLVGFHYRTAFQHGYKHAQEDAVEAARGALANAAAHKDGHKTCGNCGSSTCLQVGRHNDGCCVCWQPKDAAHKAPSLCASCEDIGEKCASDKVVICSFHKGNTAEATSLCDSEADEWADKDLCRRCHNGGCAQTGLKRDTTVCVQFTGTRP